MKIKHLLTTLVLCSSCVFNSAFAAESTLGNCMVDSMTGKERKQIAQWIFFAMAAHPDIKEYSKVSEAARNESNINFANLITRLLTQECSTQAKLAVKQEGEAAIIGSFEILGKVAMQELMTNKDVINSIGAYIKYIDQEKLKNLTSEK